MNKKGKSKLFAILGICMIALLTLSIAISASDGNASETGTNPEMKQAIDEKTDSQLSDNVINYVENFVEQKGINPEDINNVTEVNFNDLPKEVNIENINDANLAIYKIDYNKSDEKQDKVFVITYSVDKLKSQGDIIIAQDKREFLNFGFSGEIKESGFLKTAVGVDESLEKGYVMMRAGSITGISTSLEAVDGSGNIEIIIYKNGKQIQFGNSFVVNSAGVKKDYDIQSKGTVKFEQGDIISAYTKASEGISLRDITTLVEITT